MSEMPALVLEHRGVIPATLVFWLLFIAFAVKLPVWPLHTWLPDAHTDAPTAASVMLAGVLLKMGAYGMFRVSAAMFPDVLRDVSWLLAALGVINILYGAAVVLRQTDMKRLIAFSSISHMGFILLGLSSAVGVAGVVFASRTDGGIAADVHSRDDYRAAFSCWSATCTSGRTRAISLTSAVWRAGCRY